MKKVYIMLVALVIGATAVGVTVASMDGGFFNPEKHQAMLEKKAEMLGMDIEEVKASLEQGKTMREVFAEQGITKEDMAAKKQAWMQKWLSAMVGEGKITQEQADEKIAKIRETTKDCPEECKECMMHWKGRMGKGMMEPFSVEQ